MSEQKIIPSQAAARKWLGPALLVSLILNLFLGAHFVVGVMRHLDHGMHEAGPMMAVLPHGAVMAALSEGERDLLHQAMRAHREALRARFMEVRAARLALSDAVGADPYDPEKASQAFAQLRNAMSAVASSSQGALVDAFANLSPATRKRIAEALRQSRRGGGEFDARGGEGHHR